jgi:hypothetical protein
MKLRTYYRRWITGVVPTPYRSIVIILTMIGLILSLVVTGRWVLGILVTGSLVWKISWRNIFPLHHRYNMRRR